PELSPFPLTLSDQRFAQQLQRSRGISETPSVPIPQLIPERPPEVDVESQEMHPVLPVQQPPQPAVPSQPLTAQASIEPAQPQAQEKKPESPITVAASPSILKSLAKSELKGRGEQTQARVSATMPPSRSWAQNTLPPAVQATLRKIARRGEFESHLLTP